MIKSGTIVLADEISGQFSKDVKNSNAKVASRLEIFPKKHYSFQIPTIQIFLSLIYQAMH